MFASIWIGLRANAHAEVQQRYRHTDEDGEYNGPVNNRSWDVFKFFTDAEAVSPLFKVRTQGGNQHLYSVSYYREGATEQDILDEIQALADEYSQGNRIQILGMWKFTGEQFGTEHTYHTRIETRTWWQDNPDYNPVTADEAIVQWEADNPQPIHPPDPAPDATPAEVAAWQILHDQWEIDNVAWLSDRSIAYAEFQAAYDPNPRIQVTGDVEVTHVDGYTGTPIYPIPVADLLGFMPDVVVYDGDGNEISRTNATELSDVNLLLGQAPRSFYP